MITYIKTALLGKLTSYGHEIFYACNYGKIKEATSSCQYSHKFSRYALLIFHGLDGLLIRLEMGSHKRMKVAICEDQ